MQRSLQRTLAPGGTCWALTSAHACLQPCKHFRHEACSETAEDSSSRETCWALISAHACLQPHKQCDNLLRLAHAPLLASTCTYHQLFASHMLACRHAHIVTCAVTCAVTQNAACRHTANCAQLASMYMLACRHTEVLATFLETWAMAGCLADS